MNKNKSLSTIIFVISFIIGSGLVGLGFYIGYTYALTGELTKVLSNDVESEHKNYCEIPIDYCDNSIKGLEQELGIAFAKLDECVEYKNQCEQKKVSLNSKELSNCIKEKELWEIRANQTLGMVFQCSKVVDECNLDVQQRVEELNTCIMELNKLTEVMK